MSKPPVPKVGDIVEYYGSKSELHGRYKIVVAPPSPLDRGYVLVNDIHGRINHVHPISFTVLDSEEQSGSDNSMRNREELNDLGYDDEYLDTVPDFVPQLTEAIRDGVFDSHLKQIAASCLDRRDAMRGQVENRAALVTATTVPVVGDCTGPILGEGGYIELPVDNSSNAILVNDKRYSKIGLLGKRFRLLTGHGLPWYMDKVLVEIDMVGSKYMFVRALEDPKLRYPKSTELQKRGAGVGWKLKVDPTMVPHIFG